MIDKIKNIQDLSVYELESIWNSKKGKLTSYSFCNKRSKFKEITLRINVYSFENESTSNLEIFFGDKRYIDSRTILESTVSNDKIQSEVERLFNIIIENDYFLEELSPLMDYYENYFIDF